MISLKSIFELFKTGKTPTETNFRDTFSSFWHKSEKIPQSQVFGLQETIESATQGLIYRSPVATSGDLDTTYPDAKTGWAAIVEETGTIWQCEVQPDNTRVWTDTGLKEFPKDVATREELGEYAKSGGSEKTVKELDENIVQLVSSVDEKVENKTGKNLFNKETAIQGYSIGSNGNLVANENYYASAFIPVKSDTNYTKSSTPTAAWYTADRVFISYYQSKKQLSPENAAYMRTSVHKDILDAYQVEEGNVETSYEPFSPIAGYAASVANDSITAEKLSNASVTSEKIAANSVTSEKIAANSVTSKKIAANEVTNSKITDNAITPQKIKGKAVFSLQNKYSDSFGELFIYPQFRDTETEGIKYYAKITGGKLYVRPYINGSTPYVWNCAVQLPDADTYAGEPIAIVVTNAGGGIAAGTTIGYATFTDTSMWGNADGALGQILSDNIWKIGNFPIIYAKLLEPPKPEKSTTMEEDIELVLPDEFIAVEGDNLQIFHRSYIRAVNPYNYDIVVICSVGKNYPRYYELKPTASHVGNVYPVSFYVKRNDTSIIVQKASSIRVIPKITSPINNKNILVMGASATASGYLAHELRRRLTENSGDGTNLNPTGLGLSNISFVGRKTGTSKNVQLEATGGWSWVDYCGQGRAAYRFFVNGVTIININDEYTVNGVTLTVTETNITDGLGNIRCTYAGTNTPPVSGVLTRTEGSGDSFVNYSSYESERFNPFWNEETGKLDFINYANQYCSGKIDVLITHCGVNDIFAGRTGDVLFDTYIKPFARALNADFPNAKMVISMLPLLDVTGGMGASYGASAHNYMSRNIGIWQFADALTKMVQDAEFSGYVSQACVLQEFDNENGYPTSTVNVNNRTAIAEKRGNNGAHPTEFGSYMVADSIYRAINDLTL